MSENVDRIIDTHLTQRPGARHAYNNDPTMHHDIERARSMLTVVEAAMRREGIPYDSAERVLNEVVSAGLDGWERDKVSRERLLLLADMNPSPADSTITQLFTELPEDSPVRDDVTPERLNAWLEKRAAALRDATGFDLRTDEEKNA